MDPLSVVCPRCDSAIGFPCTSVSSRYPRSAPHKMRTEKAKNRSFYKVAPTIVPQRVTQHDDEEFE